MVALGEARAALADLSPLNHAANAASPLLIYHGANDTLVPAAHSLNMVTALKAAGKEVNLLISPTEGHGFPAPTTEMAVYRAIEIFLGLHLSGQVGGQPNQSVQTALGELQTAGQNPWKR